MSSANRGPPLGGQAQAPHRASFPAPREEEVQGGGKSGASSIPFGSFFSVRAPFCAPAVTRTTPQSVASGVKEVGGAAVAGIQTGVAGIKTGTEKVADNDDFRKGWDKMKAGVGWMGQKAQQGAMKVRVFRGECNG